jgi:hypothetical protein
MCPPYGILRCGKSSLELHSHFYPLLSPSPSCSGLEPPSVFFLASLIGCKLLFGFMLCLLQKENKTKKKVSFLIVFVSKTAFMKENEIGLPNQGGAVA